MIQRIQSFYLVLAAVCVALLFMFPIATYTNHDAVLGLEINSELNLIPKDYVYSQVEMGDAVPTFVGQIGHKPSTWPLVAIAGAMGIIALVSIFMYKNRPRQMKVVACGFLLNVVFVFLVFFLYVDKFTTNIGVEIGNIDIQPKYSVGTWAPIVSVLFFFLAQRAIKKDELKVRAADRLR